MVNTIRTTPPGVDEQPTWAEHWATVAHEWELAAREVCQLAGPTQAAATSYLQWKPGQASAGETPWWHSDLDWEKFAGDLAGGRTTLSSTEKALARVAIGLVQGHGEVEYQALLSAGYLNDVLAIVRRCADAIDDGGRER